MDKQDNQNPNGQDIDEPQQEPVETTPPEDEQAQDQPQAIDQKAETKTFEPKVLPPQGGHKKYYKHILLVIILLITAAVVWWFYFKDNNSQQAGNQSSQEQTEQEQAVTAEPTTPDTVAYAFKATDDEPYTLYWRPAAGGDRKEAKKLAKDEHIASSDVWGGNVAVVTGEAIYISTDSGKTYPNSVDLSTGAQITGLKFSADGQRIAYGLLTAVGGENTLKSVNLEGKDSKDLFTSKKAGVFIHGYSPKENKIVYSEGCFNCDGMPDLPVVRNLESDKVESLVKGIEPTELVSVAVSNDFTTAVYATSTANTANEGLGAYATAPFTINSIDLATNEVTKITTFGEKDEKNPNGTLKLRIVMVGFIRSSSGPYYTNDTQLFAVKSGKPANIFESDKLVLGVAYAGSELVFVQTGAQTGDHVLSSYNISTKKSTSIYEGDNNTFLFGVTTK